jgi:hypothetical protein
MDADRFDRLTKTLTATATRRLAVRGLIAALAVMVRSVTQISDPTIVRGAGGSGNRAIVGGGGHRRRHDPNHHHHHHLRRKDRKCRPKSRSTLCQGNCDQIIEDGCGGKVDCTCQDGSVCAPANGECCQPDQLCAGKSVCCPQGEVCGPGDACCLSERACFLSNECCPAGEECTRNGGTCCPVARICVTGGVPASCCEGVNRQCVDGICIFT